MDGFLPIDILLVLSSGFLGALLMKIIDSIAEHKARPVLEVENVVHTPSIDGNVNYLSISLRNSGKTQALNCIGKVIITDEKGNEEVYQVPWGIATNPNKYTIYPKDEVKLDLFQAVRETTGYFQIPQALGEIGSVAPGVAFYYMQKDRGNYKVLIKVIGENVYLEHDMGLMLLPDRILNE